MTHYTVTNILQDGTRLESMDGFVLPEELSRQIIFILTKEDREEVTA